MKNSHSYPMRYSTIQGPSNSFFPFDDWNLLESTRQEPIPRASMKLPAQHRCDSGAEEHAGRWVISWHPVANPLIGKSDDELRHQERGQHRL